ncbi:alpha/beta hydrolase [Larkinella soli]|uniref:alpha/beta hydrolase n=1 Tax=Larkinella soli TaxID=1770527 RepID=UPI000FFC64CB|nr:alpha/beta hydrolase [Larkinella soli]
MSVSPLRLPGRTTRSRYHLLWQVPAGVLVLMAVLTAANEWAVARSVHRTKDLAYVEAGSPGFPTERHRLDVFAPAGPTTAKRPVVVFIHGGSWNSGSKNLYGFIGRRLAHRGLVAVVINYRLSPSVQVPAMAEDCARAVVWTQKHIGRFGGDGERIFVMGHSAGGGLAALLAVDDSLFSRLGSSKNPVRGAVLDDPAGLDMLDYLRKMEYPGDEQYLVPFGRDPAVWRSMSALYRVRSGIPPLLVYVGEKTYPSIARSTRKFRDRLRETGAPFRFTVFPGKKHVGMVAQLFWKNNRIYKDLLHLVETGDLPKAE